ncbi:MAG: hypothetical protein MZV49_18305 [Rhodopseudomonas palustris]|nr:hypothetical protein [Rhodopseudomonas palustris]
MHTGHQTTAGAPTAPVTCRRPICRSIAVTITSSILRPDVSVKAGTPNACNDCHKDRRAWAAAAIEKWHGPTRKGKGHQTYAEAFHLARARS